MGTSCLGNTRKDLILRSYARHYGVSTCLLELKMDSCCSTDQDKVMDLINKDDKPQHVSHPLADMSGARLFEHEGRGI